MEGPKNIWLVFEVISQIKGNLMFDFTISSIDILFITFEVIATQCVKNWDIVLKVDKMCSKPREQAKVSFKLRKCSKV